MLRLSPPALTAGLHRPFGVGLHSRSGVPGFRPRAAYGFRLRADSKFMIFFITNKISNSFFAKTRVSALPRKRGNYVCISKGILPGGESGLWIYETVLFFYNKPVSYLSFRLCLERLFGHVRHFSSSDSPLSSSSG